MKKIMLILPFIIVVFCYYELLDNLYTIEVVINNYFFVLFIVLCGLLVSNKVNSLEAKLEDDVCVLTGIIGSFLSAGLYLIASYHLNASGQLLAPTTCLGAFVIIYMLSLDALVGLFSDVNSQDKSLDS